MTLVFQQATTNPPSKKFWKTTLKLFHFSINRDNILLQDQVEELKKEAEDSEYNIKASLDEKDKKIKELKEELCLVKESQKEILALMKDKNLAKVE
jgi:hypothetical protein